MNNPLHRHRIPGDKHGAFGQDKFGQQAERFARFFGTPKFIVGQTVVVLLWIVLNVFGVIHHWDPYPFILLNLMFSTQAAYAAPLILLAQTRQADRDKAAEDANSKHREEIAATHSAELQKDIELTTAVHQMQEQLLTVITLVRNGQPVRAKPEEGQS